MVLVGCTTAACSNLHYHRRPSVVPHVQTLSTCPHRFLGLRSDLVGSVLLAHLRRAKGGRGAAQTVLFRSGSKLVPLGWRRRCDQHENDADFKRDLRGGGTLRGRIGDESARDEARTSRMAVAAKSRVSQITRTEVLKMLTWSDAVVGLWRVKRSSARVRGPCASRGWSYSLPLNQGLLARRASAT